MRYILAPIPYLKFKLETLVETNVYVSLIWYEIKQVLTLSHVKSSNSSHLAPIN